MAKHVMKTVAEVLGGCTVLFICISAEGIADMVVRFFNWLRERLLLLMAGATVKSIDGIMQEHNTDTL